MTQDWDYSDDDAPDAPPKGKPRVVIPIEDAKRIKEIELRAKWPALDVPGIFAELDPIDYLVSDLDICPGAPTLLAAYGFSGKTMVTQAMALAIASGSRIWDKYECKQGKALHIDYEQGARLSRDRYQRLAKGMQLTPADLGDRLSLVSMPQHYMDNEGSEQFMLKACDGFNLAIVDSFRACSPTVDENDSEARLVLDKLTRVSEKTGCCFIVIHHARKPDRNGGKVGGAMMDIRGSGALFDACACVLHLGTNGKDEARILSQSKARNRGTKTPDIRIDIFDVADGENARAGLVVRATDLASDDPVVSGTPKPQHDKYRKIIIDIFSREPASKSANAIFSLSGASRNAIFGAISAMESRGELVRGSDRLYRLDSSAVVKDMAGRELY